MRNKKIKELESIFLQLKKSDNNINGIGVGIKITGGVETGEKALVIYVKEKIEKDKLDPTKIIPPTLYFSDMSLVTDVVGAKHTTCPSCYPDADSLFPPSSELSPIYNNRANLNILSGGCNFTRWSPTDYLTMCTLGGIFKDKLDNSYVGLTNRHCVDKIVPITIEYVNRINNNDTYTAVEYIDLPFINFYGYINFQSEYTTSTTSNNVNYNGTSVNFIDTVQNYNMRNTHYYQPSRFTFNEGVPVVDVLSGSNCIGFFKRAISVLPSNNTTENYFNYVDGAIIGITNKLDPTSKRQIGFNFDGQISIATDEEIDFIVDNQLPLFYSGSRSGPVGAPGSNASCSLQATANIRILETEESRRFQDRNFGDQVLYYFSDCVEFKSNTNTAILGGDSGSIIWGQLPTGWKIIGLNFAGSTYTETGEVRGLFCRITNVFRELNIDVWNGEQLNYSKQTHEVVLENEIDFTKTVDGNEVIVNDIEIDGKKYYFTGMKNTNKYNNIDYKI